MVAEECMLKGCDRTARAKGLCLGHYQQQRRGQKLRPLRDYNNEMIKDENGRGCTLCGRYKPWDEFYARHLSRCKPCHNKKVA